MKPWQLIFPAVFLNLSAFAAEPVTVTPYSDVAIYLERQVAAQVESLNESVLAAEISARVSNIEVRPGQDVEVGQLLLRLDAESFLIGRDVARARLEIAAAGLDMARLRAERARRLAPEKFVSEDQLLEAETRLRQAEAEVQVAEQDLANAELMLRRTEIRAPFAGVVSARLIGLGSLASPGTPLLELIARDQLEVVASVAPERIAGLEQASGMVFETGEQSRSVELARVSGVISGSSRSIEARFVFTDEPVRPGSEGRIRWSDPRPALPADYIVLRNGELGVLVLDEDQRTAGFIRLPGADAGRPHQVDLPSGTLLIDTGRQRIQPGDSVRLQ
jgi:RND family efflux transporter MFP subunit